MMNAKQAWENFARTGKVEDYLRYTQIKNQQFTMEVRGAAENPGTDYPGADHRGERPPRYGAHS